jgi:hypothetical protein
VVEVAHDLGVGMKHIWDKVFGDIDIREGIKEVLITNISNPDLDPSLFFDSLGNVIDSMEVASTDMETSLVDYLHKQIMDYRAWRRHFNRHSDDLHVRLRDIRCRGKVLAAFEAVYPKIRLYYNMRIRRQKDILLNAMEKYAASARPVVQKELGMEIERQLNSELDRATNSQVEDEEETTDEPEQGGEQDDSSS